MIFDINEIFLWKYLTLGIYFSWEYTEHLSVPIWKCWDCKDSVTDWGSQNKAKPASESEQGSQNTGHNIYQEWIGASEDYGQEVFS